MTVAELIEALKYAQDPNEPELEVWVAQHGSHLTDRVKLVKRQSVFVDCDPRKQKTVAMIETEDSNDSQ